MVRFLLGVAAWITSFFYVNTVENPTWPYIVADALLWSTWVACFFRWSDPWPLSSFIGPGLAGLFIGVCIVIGQGLNLVILWPLVFCWAVASLFLWFWQDVERKQYINSLLR